ncbi:TIGR02281 family clan AA aspartic protease [Rhodobacter sphaeroides]|jgi:aspartyl protease family protein|uniref:Clan AA aspartic protease, TIGR02281 family n=1 Tax=Cereibacter sphaeroides (strain ATCC 17023 / DSM 158 / JCM 6121 / CCUG 31486 / LMG 2827 / NBRC 12203 / NCIMB 8253 / ATH 2.4.1.) TaxID=272943 RepID=Q3J2C7_CERS4|nr:TIGR02281 family clan AA aspartic protease [Cereibacter sphaeroides]ABA79057.1 clan AA aspartic protease, TIGR02281 family [Cereibacter sphaeroides 2.4.1]AMJ47376.1 aspartyl protease [Cereibacter sphaeroides]ANS34089.1 aspartyl protease [Cereibacter sphaeroides]ATN63133.1 aspartyl protease [Cereibacter sphaeroides]AXC61265.1 TIGR02281 family clan AA aspartic protease [Cereibacter sphaeroides 2.4.1]
MDGDLTARLIYLGLLLTALGAWVLVEYRGRLGAAIRAGLAWALIFVAVLAGYGLWRDIRSDLIPTQAVMEDSRIAVPRARDGHYYLTLEVAGTPIRFMADTGASSIVLSQADARRLGIEPDRLDYMGEAITANGPVRTARVRIGPVVLGPYSEQRIPAWVNEGPMDMSLLGMDYLRRFRIEIADDRMILSR